MSTAISKILGFVIGSVLIAASVVAIFFIDWTVEVPPPEVPIRPIKTFVVTTAYSASTRQYPGRVGANEEVDLAFQVAGPLTEMRVRDGQEVAEGEILAQIDQRDFKFEVDAARATMIQAKDRYERTKTTFDRGAATELEMINAQSIYERANAELSIRLKALEDTTLKAPFAGVIARRYVENFQNVQSKEAVVRLQDIADVEIKVNVPEQRLSQIIRNREQHRLIAVFEYLPGREFEVKVKEVSTEADPVTQTYEATLVMPAPEDVRILPGMTVTVNETLEEARASESGGFMVPVAIVPVDGTGNYYVWKIEPGDGGIATVRRVGVKVGEMMGDQILVTAGVSAGDHLAAAGVTLLSDGQRVRLLEAQAERSAG